MIFTRDLILPNYNWSIGTPMHDSYCCSKMKRNLMYMIVCFLGLNQHNDSLSNNLLLNLVFSNIRDSLLSISYFHMGSLDSYPSLVNDCKLI